MISLFLGNWKIFAMLGAAIAVAGAVWAYGRSQYNAGVTDTTQTFLKADMEGAKNVRSTAKDILDSIASDADVDELLRDTGGLRD